MTTYQLTPKGKALGDRLYLENPCPTGSVESQAWVQWAYRAICQDGSPPTDSDPAAAHEGYEWGCDFNKEWTP